jgi:hypothetical protein
MTTAPTTTETILQEDGAEATLEAFAAEVREGEQAIRAVVAEAPGKAWPMRELEDLAAEGRRPTAMSVALMGLIRSDELRLDLATSVVTQAD